MKKIYLLALGLLSGISLLQAQSSLEVTNGSTGLTIPNGGVVYRGTTVGIEDLLEINIKNTSGSTKAYKFRRYDDVVNPGADPYFCVQQCYTPATMISPVSLTLTANQDAVSAGVQPSLHLMDNTTAGQSEIRYHIYDVANPTVDLFVVTIKYNNPLSVKDAAGLFSSVSSIFPNPSASKSFVNVTTAGEVAGVKINVINSLGSVVSAKTVDLNAGKNTLTIDTENLVSGIYFVAITYGSSSITRKITISK